MVSNSTATRKRYFHIPQVKSGVSALPNDSMNIAECTFMFGEWDIGFLVSISGECDMDFQDPFLESVI